MDMINEILKVSLKSCASDNCSECRYYKYKSTCLNDLTRDALKYIGKLEAKLKTSELERKALSRTVNSIVYCDECVHYHGECCDYVTYIDEHDKVHRAKDVRICNDYCSYGERREGEDDEQQQ